MSNYREKEKANNWTEKCKNKLNKNKIKKGNPIRNKNKNKSLEKPAVGRAGIFKTVSTDFCLYLFMAAKVIFS